MPYSSTYQPIALHVLQHSRNANRFAFFVEHPFPVGVPSSVLTRPFSRTSKATEFARRTDFRVQVHVVGDQEIARADDGRRRTFR